MTKLVKTSYLTPCCEQLSEHPLKQSTLMPLVRASWQEILFAACVLCMHSLAKELDRSHSNSLH